MFCHLQTFYKPLLADVTSGFIFSVSGKMSLDGSRCISKLLNSMIEVCVVVGMDQDTGLVPTPEVREDRGIS